MAQEIHLIVIGKLKDIRLETIEQDYLKRINSPKLIIHELKAITDNPDKEGAEILKKVTELKGKLVLLAEEGEIQDSHQFSKWMFNELDKNSNLILVIGGALGHGDEIKKQASQKLSLSPLTFPHKLARILLVEQIYRATTIKTGHPYHH